MTSLAIIVACLASFRILYTKSERSRRSALIDGQSNRATEHLGNLPGVPLNARVLRRTSVFPSENIYHNQQTSVDSFEEAILPMDNVYVQHRYNLFSGSGKTYEET